jgi:ribosomal protein L39E
MSAYKALDIQVKLTMKLKKNWQSPQWSRMRTNR